MALENIIDFLAELRENNNRDWFQSHKGEYETAKTIFEEFINETIAKVAAHDKSIAVLTAKDCIFRIYRDVRFSGDKSPYKTNMGAFVSKYGRKSSGPGYYFHIEPGASMMAAGVYMPSPAQLSAIRHAIYTDTQKFKKIIEKDSFAKMFPHLDDFDKLKKAPKDYPADFQYIDLLKYKSYIVSRNFSDQDVISGKMQKETDGFLNEVDPFIKFLYAALA